MPRPKKIADPKEMLETAHLFYYDYLSKKEISGKLKIDPRHVAWLLTEARRQKIVTIQIYESPVANLQERIKAKFNHLDKVIIAAGGRVDTPDKHAELFQRWAVMAANYFNELYGNHPRNKPWHVGVAGGEHVLEFVNAVIPMDRENLHIHVTALIGRGRLSESTIHNDPVVNASVLWSHSGRFPGRSEYATVSPYVTSRPGPAARVAVREEIEKVEANQAVVEVIKAMNDIDVVFVGIGAVNVGRTNPLTRNRITMTGLLENVVTTEQLAREGAKGDLAYNLFDAKGNSHPKKWQFFLTAGHGSDHAGVEFYKQMLRNGKKVVVFGGPYQLEPIRIALEAKMFNVWITDEHTARQIAED